MAKGSKKVEDAKEKTTSPTTEKETKVAKTLTSPNDPADVAKVALRMVEINAHRDFNLKRIISNAGVTIDKADFNIEVSKFTIEPAKIASKYMEKVVANWDNKAVTDFLKKKK